MTEDPIRQAIREFVTLQQQVLLAGGFSPNASVYTELRRLQWEIVGLFGLPASRKYVKLLSEYPFSLIVRQPEQVKETLADLYYCQWFSAFFLNGCLARGYFNDDVCFGNIVAKVEFIHWRLTLQAQQELDNP